MCGIWKRYKHSPDLLKREISIDDLIKFFEINKKSLRKLKNIGITGGEPTLKRGLTKLIMYLRENYPNTRIGIQTNGLFPERQLKVIREIYEIYPEVGISISLDGIGKTHDMIRGVKNAYQNAIYTIKEIRRMGVKAIMCGCTILKENIHEIEKIALVSKELGCEFSCFLPEGGEYFANDSSYISLSMEEKREIISVLEKFSYHYYMDNLRLQLLGKRKREINCYSGQSSIVIDPYGNIKPCLILEETFGNIKNGLLKDILSSSSVTKKRIELKKCKKCFLQCEVGVAVLMDFTDLVKWFLLYCRDKRGFIETYFKKYNNIIYRNY